MSEVSPLAAAALELAATEHHVFPCVPGGKAPLTPQGHLDATTDADTIRAWWAQYPTANIGIALAPSGLVVLDVDRHGSVDGRIELAKIKSELSETRVAQTGGGGYHLYYRRGDARAARRIHWRPGLDLLADGYVIAAPSTLEGGGAYAWRSEREPAPAPELLVRGLAERARPAASAPLDDVTDYGPASERVLAAARERLERHGPSVKGRGGDQHTYQVGAILLHDFALAEDEAWTLAAEWNDRNTSVPGNPKWSDEKLALKLRNGARYAQGPRGRARALADLELFERASPAAVVERPAAADIKGELRAARDKLKRSSRGVDRTDADALAAILVGKSPPSEITPEIAARALRRRAPASASDAQLVDLACHHWSRDALAAAFAALGPADLEIVPSGAGYSPEGFRVDDKGRPLGNQENLRVALDMLEISIGYNLFTEQAVCDGEPLTDAIENRIEATLETKFGLAIEFSKFRRYLDVFAREHGYHPVRDYLDGLTWDGVPRLSSWLVNYGGAKVDGDEHAQYVAEIGRIVLQAAVRRVRQPGCKYDELVVFESPIQGANKSTAIEILAVQEDWYTNDIPLDGDPKVLIETTAGKWIIEAAEIIGLERSRAKIKRVLSTKADNARLAFRRNAERHARQWVAIGTSNRQDYLGDESGDRRFWPVEITRFDLDALRRDRDQLWAEAVALDNAAFAAGGNTLACARIRLDERLWAVAGKAQDSRSVGDPIEDTLAAVLDGRDGSVREADALDLAGFERPTKEDATRVGMCLRRLGWKRDRLRVGNGARVWIWKRGTGPLWQINQLRSGPAFGKPPSAALHVVTPHVPDESSK